MSATTTVAGMKFSDTLAALLDHALAYGFRIEPDTRGRGKLANSCIVYPADRDQSPINISERGAKYNRAHYENIRRQLYRAGLDPLPADQPSHGLGVIAAETAEEAQALAGPDAALLEVGEDVTVSSADGRAMTLDLKGDNASHIVGTLVAGFARQMGLGNAEAALAAGVVDEILTWSRTYSPDRVAESAERIRAELEAEYRGDIKTALDLAAQHEATAARLTKDIEKADAREKKAREDCAAALRRAEEAEATAARLEAALAPLRAVLGGQQ